MRENGSGLLSRHLVPQKDLLDSFVLHLGFAKLLVQPRVGRIKLDGTTKFSTGEQGKLVWFRRMQKSIATHDKTNDAAECLWYGVGLEHGGKRFGYRLYADGSLREGLDA